MKAGSIEKLTNLYYFLVFFQRPFAFKTKWINEEIIVLIWAVFHMSEKKGLAVETMVILMFLFRFSECFSLE